MQTNSIWCRSALLKQGWAEDVLFDIDPNGLIQSIKTDTSAAELDQSVSRLGGVLIPGIPNLHSHAHQRAMAGLSELASGSGDSFWTWRKAMYHFLAKIEPDQLYHIARMLYLEMLQAGYTRVGEFQYLHHDLAGKPYANRAEMTLQCRQAAADVGIGFTALPVFYCYGGFGEQQSGVGQKRFINDVDGFLEIVSLLHKQKGQHDRVGIAPHSLRAISQSGLQKVLDEMPVDCRVHLHIAEQIKEVDDCFAWSGQRPVAWLYNHFKPDHNWCLIHATHMDQAETKMLAQSNTIAGLCPATEGNLGDGFFNAEEFISARGIWGIGSDSHISVSPVEELRWLEYGQRLLSGGRNVLVGESEELMHTGRYLFSNAARGGAAACETNAGELAVDKQADFILLDSDHPRLYGRQTDSLLDSWIFSGNEDLVSAVYVAGKKVTQQEGHNDKQLIQQKYRQTIDQLMA